MTPVRRTALNVGFAVIAWLAAVALALAVGARPAAAQGAFSAAVTCTDTDMTFNWLNAPTGSAQIEVWYGDPPYSSANRDQRITLTVVTGNRIGQRSFTVPFGTTGYAAMSVLAGSGLSQAAVEFTCTVSDAAETTLLTDILAELQTIDSRLTNVNRNVQMTTTNVADVEVLLTATNERLGTSNAHLAVMQTALTDPLIGLPRVLGDIDAELAEISTGTDALIDLQLQTVALLKDHPAQVNQTRNQTHALLALVAIMFALWLRPIFRSRNTVS